MESGRTLDLIPPVESGSTLVLEAARLARDVASGVVVVVEGHHPGLVSRMTVAESRTGGVPQAATQVGEDLDGEVYVKPSLTLLNATARLKRKPLRSVAKSKLMVPVLNVVLLPLITSVMVRR